jgi:hypothetical protein
MVRLLFVMLLFALNTIVVNAQKSADISIDSFDKLVVFGSIEVNLVKGEKESVKLESETVNLEDITVKNDGNKLKISTTDKLTAGEKQVKITLVYKKIREVTVNGGAQLYCDKKIKGDKIKLDAGTGGTILLEVDLNALEAESGQGSTISVKGKTKMQEVRANSGGIYNAYELNCDNTYAYANTGAVVKVRVVEQLKANSSTGAFIGYIGEPKKKDISKVLGGDVQQASESEK